MLAPYFYHYALAGKLDPDHRAQNPSVVSYLIRQPAGYREGPVPCRTILDHSIVRYALFSASL